MKNKKSWLGMLAMVLVFGITVIGCATTVHSVEISNVSTNNIREIYIRNAGTTNWGSNVARDLQNIDKSRFSETVDIRVVDINGIVYEKYNVPFGDTAFELTGQESSLNWVVQLVLAVLTLVILIPLV